MSSTQMPLLCKGYFSNTQGTADSIPVMAGVVNWSNTIEKNRGRVIAVDLIKTAVRTPGGLSAPVNLSIGGEVVLDNSPLNNYLLYAWPSAYAIPLLEQDGGQTIQFLNTGAQTGGACVHVYFHNPWDTPEVWAARETSRLKTRWQDIWANIGSGNKNGTSNQLTIPSNKGNVVAIQLLTENPAAQDTSAVSTMSVLIDGVKIFDNVSALLGDPQTARPNLVFPCVISPGATLEILADTSRAVAGQTARFGVRVYFDDEVGRMPYKPNCP